MKLLQWIKNKVSRPEQQCRQLAHPCREEKAPADGRTYAGNGNWPFVVDINGQDAVLRAVHGRTLRATNFGGDNDPMDNGETASGINTKGNHTVLGCALPMLYKGTEMSCAGSPIPKLPWKTLVEVTISGRKITIPLIDVGPNIRTGNSIDLTLAAFKKFAPLSKGVLQVDEVRIKGGAKYFV
jgi:Lytic transglycolase